jgi:hypothetical protein
MWNVHTEMEFGDCLEIDGSSSKFTGSSVLQLELYDSQMQIRFSVMQQMRKGRQGPVRQTLATM